MFYQIYLKNKGGGGENIDDNIWRTDLLRCIRSKETFAFNDMHSNILLIQG